MKILNIFKWIYINGHIIQRAYKYQDLDEEAENYKIERAQTKLQNTRRFKEKRCCDYEVKFKFVEWNRVMWLTTVKLFTKWSIPCELYYWFSLNWKFGGGERWRMIHGEVDTHDTWKVNTCCNLERVHILFKGFD